MNHKLRPQRLSQLYADIDLPVFDPAEHTLQIRQASESLPSQVESQSSDVILLPEKNQMDFADSHAAADVLGVATVSMSTHTIPAPITSQAGIDAELQAAPPLGRPLKTDEPQTDWKAVGIGVVTGTAVSGLILVATFPMHIFNNPGRFALWGGEMFLGIIGALLANAGKSTTRELWRAAIEWALIPIWFALLIAFMLLLLMFTSITG
jgi:hypothetical protein